MLAELEKEYAYLWDGSDRDWVLVKSTELPGHFMIFNDRTSTALSIDDNGMQRAVCRRMQEAGCKIIENITPRSVIVRPIATPEQ